MNEVLQAIELWEERTKVGGGEIDEAHPPTATSSLYVETFCSKEPSLRPRIEATTSAVRGSSMAEERKEKEGREGKKVSRSWRTLRR